MDREKERFMYLQVVPMKILQEVKNEEELL